MRVIALVHRPEDLAAVRIAIPLGETTVLAAAKEGEATESLLENARLAGAIRTIRLWDPSLEFIDYFGMACALAAAVRTLAATTPDEAPVIVCGDSGRGAVGPALAERLSVPHLSSVIAARKMDDRVVASRHTGSLVRLYAAQPPLLLCAAAAPGLSDPESAGWTAATASTEGWSLANVGLTATELSYRRRYRPRPLSGSTAGPLSTPHRFADIASLLARLRQDGLVPGGE
jgi:electron transfer flavoprotein alpha/beta subunit